MRALPLEGGEAALVLVLDGENEDARLRVPQLDAVVIPARDQQRLLHHQQQPVDSKSVRLRFLPPWRHREGGRAAVALVALNAIGGEPPVLVAHVQRAGVAHRQRDVVHPAVEVTEALLRREPRVHQQLAALVLLPDLDRHVGRGRDEDAIAVGEARHRAAVAAQGLHQLLRAVLGSGRRIPHPHRAVSAAGEEQVALLAEIRAADEQHAAHETRVSLEDHGLLINLLDAL